MATPSGMQHPTPILFFDTVNGFQRSAAVKAAIELDLFTAVSGGAREAATIASATNASERGIRILCDYLVVLGFLTKENGRYSATLESEMFLNRKSQAYAGGAVEFLLNPHALDVFDHLTDTVRNGGRRPQDAHTLAPEDEMWIKFAKGMMPMMVPGAQSLAANLPLPNDRPTRVLDIAASHGMWGITIGLRFHDAQIVGLDWDNVLQVARANANRLGLGARYSTIAGSAFEVDFEGPYDAILLPNFLHHFDKSTCEMLLKKCASALHPGGLVAIVEFVPNDDRVSPPMDAMFALTMLAGTPAGDAYTEREIVSMLQTAGLQEVKRFQLTAMPQSVILAKKG